MGSSLWRKSASTFVRLVRMDGGEVVRELLNVAARAGIAVRFEPLDPDLFERRRGGICRIGGVRTIVLDARASTEEKMVVLLHSLSSVDLDAVYMLPQLREEIAHHRRAVTR